MRKIKTLSLTVSILFLSACSLGSGNDGGIYRSNDGGKTFSSKNQAENNKTIDAVDVLSLAINSQNGREVYLGTKANGIFKSGDGGELWRQLKVSESTPIKVYSVVLDQFDPKIVYAATVLEGRGKIIKSTDAGEAWKEIYTEPADGSLVLSLALNPQNSQNIFAGTDQGQILSSGDGGETWRSVFWTREKKAVYRIAYDNFDTNTIYFVIFQSGVLRTADGGVNFEELKQKAKLADFYETGEGLQNPVSIKTDPARAGWVYVGTSDGLLRSKDKGDNWEIIKTLNRAEEYNIRSIDVNPANSDELVCTAAQTFYKSNDGGVNWFPIQSNSNRTLEIVEYDPQNPEVIYVGLNKC